MSHGHSRSLTHRAAHATWWSALEIAARYGVQFLVMVLLARMLAPSDFGLIAMLLVFTTVSALLVDSGFGTALVQKQQTTDDEETTVFLSGLAVSVVVGTVLWLAAPAIAQFYSQPLLSPLARLLLFVLPLSALAAVPDALLTQQLDFRARANAEIFASLCSGSVAVFLAWRGFGVWSLAWQSIVAIAVRAGLLWLYSHWRPRGRFRVEAFRRLFGFGSYMLLANLLETLAVRVQSLLIGRLFDSRALGYYTLAQSTQQAPALFISGLLNRVGLPVFSIAAAMPDKLLAALRWAMRVANFVFMPCMVGIAVIAGPLVEFLYGPRWAPASMLLSILSLSAIPWPAHLLTVSAINATGRSDYSFRLALVKRIAMILLIVASSPLGSLAIAWAVLVSSVLSYAVNIWFAQKLLGYGVRAQLRDQSATAGLSALAALAAWLVLHWSARGSGAMVLAIAAAVLVYGGVAMMTRNPAFTDLLELGRALRAGQPPQPTVVDRRT